MVYGLISEFNPFHNGHKWLIEQVKGEENTVITVMSGSFVQRGDISIINKYDKARASLQNGVDLVIELPAVYSLANAEIFAKSAVSILDKTGVTDRLFFGSECGDIDVINNALDIINNQNVQAKIKKNMNKGLYYPKAVYSSIKELYNEETAKIFDGSNNILGLEYLKALKDTKMSGVTFKRTGSDHDSNEVTENIANGSFIRKNYSDKELYIPKYPIQDTAVIENIEKLIIYKISQMTENELREIPDVAEGIEKRIIDCAGRYNSFTELCNGIKTKRYTMARIRRILCCAVLGITRETQSTEVPYIKVLGFTKKGEKLLSKIKESSPIPLITNVKAGYDALDKKGKKIMDIDLLATRLWSLSSNNSTVLKNDFTQPIIKE